MFEVLVAVAIFAGAVVPLAGILSGSSRDIARAHRRFHEALLLEEVLWEAERGGEAPREESSWKIREVPVAQDSLRQVQAEWTGEAGALSLSRYRKSP